VAGKLVGQGEKAAQKWLLPGFARVFRRKLLNS
jgi:hypothetical protein